MGLRALIFVVGAVTLVAEIATARLLAPYFGASTFIWANTIAIVLLALSVGYWLGGRLADRRPSERDLRMMTLGAAGLLALLPLLADPFFDLAVTAFDEIDVGAALASLAGVLVLVAFPLVLLGAVGPWAIRLLMPSVEEAGRTAGRVYALSTLGSLVGTFLAALVLVPEVGAQRTFLLGAAALALAASATGLSRAALLAPAAVLALVAIPPGITRGGGSGNRVLAERETPYQYVRVEERDDGERRLILNEGQAVHSVWRAETVLTDDEWDGYLVLPFAARATPPRSMAMLGNAAGTVSRAYERFFPSTRIDGVEIDPDLTEIGRRYFGMDNPRLTTFSEDARPFLAATDRRYDVIGLDAYRQPYIPFYLATREFFALARDRLAPGGTVIVNVGHPPGNDDLERTLSATMGAAFSTVVRFPIEETNTLLVASEAPLSPAGILRAARQDPELAPLARRAAAQTRAPLRGGRVYSDDRAPVEWLIDASILDYAAGGGG
ncbi:MAG: spermidine synthase [Solirubrobacteraceae bacterium]